MKNKIKAIAAGNTSSNVLPSRFQINDKVEVNFFDAGKIKNCEIIRVHFTESKVMYDVAVMMNKNSLNKKMPTHYTRLYNVDSVFVYPTSILSSN